MSKNIIRPNRDSLSVKQKCTTKVAEQLALLRNFKEGHKETKERAKQAEAGAQNETIHPQSYLKF